VGRIFNKLNFSHRHNNGFTFLFRTVILNSRPSINCSTIAVCFKIVYGHDRLLYQGRARVLTIAASSMPSLPSAAIGFDIRPRSRRNSACLTRNAFARQSCDGSTALLCHLSVVRIKLCMLQPVQALAECFA
jgi:hypothetical protein